VSVAKAADVAIVFVGGSRTTDSEGADRKDIELYGRQNELVKAVLAANPNTIVVLNNGAPLALPWIDRAPAVIEAWLPGQGGADALTKILFGVVNPSGKLPITLPRRIEDSPAFISYTGGRDAHYGEGVFVGYRYYDKKKIAPLFPFGHGLSYTTFAYSNLRVPEKALVGQLIEISIDVKNTGKRPGQETVQLYVGDAATKAVLRPIKELKGFKKVNLNPGAIQTLKFALTARDLLLRCVCERLGCNTG
jgi:beta-glucosidase